MKTFGMKKLNSNILKQELPQVLSLFVNEPIENLDWGVSAKKIIIKITFVYLICFNKSLSLQSIPNSWYYMNLVVSNI
jgi:hypothetical protein